MTKKILSILLTLAMVLAIAPVSVFAKDDILNYLTYKINDGNVTITGCDVSISGDVTIPDTIEGYPVTEIGDSAFFYVNITNINIPDSVTTIGDSAFFLCENLTAVTIGDNVTAIGDSAFEACLSLTSVIIPANVTSIGNKAFADCRNLKSITVDEANSNYSSDEYGILFNKDKTELVAYPKGNTATKYTVPTGVTTICDYAFYYCNNITNIELPDSVTIIEDYAFSCSAELKNINLPDNLQSIGKNSFEYCKNLDSINLPEGLKFLGQGAFENCSSLKSIIIPNSIQSLGIAPFAGSGIESAEIPAGLTARAMIYCNKLKNVKIIDDGTDTIGELAFFYCSSLKEIEISNSITTIDDFAFAFCSSLTDVAMGNNVSNINQSAFAFCAALESINLPDSITKIGDTAFTCCTMLDSINISENIEEIGEYAFACCDSLNTLKIKNPEAKIGNYSIGISSLKFKEEDQSEYNELIMYLAMNDPVLGIYFDNEYYARLEEIQTSYGNNSYSHITLYGYADSTAETYATKHGLSFVKLTENTSTDDIIDAVSGNGFTQILKDFFNKLINFFKKIIQLISNFFNN